MKNILLQVDDDYASALSLMAIKINKSRKAMMEDLMKELIDQNPTLLSQAREAFNMKLETPGTKTVLEESVKRYKFFRKAGGFDFNEGRNPQEALAAIHGRFFPHTEYLETYTHHEIV